MQTGREQGAAGRTLGYVPALDGIRGLAVVAVLLFHGDLIDGGYLGVDAFFVLSGFLITSLLLAETGATQRVDLGNFWLRRARRLLPALFAVLLGVALFALLLADATELGRIRSDAFATLGYVANWHSIASDNGYWSLFQRPSPLEHTWSLAIEEQFYLVWPLVVFAVAWLLRSRFAPAVSWRARATRGDRRRPTTNPVAPALLALSVVLGAASAVLMFVSFDPNDTSRAYLGTDTRAASILIGAALASYLAWRGPARRVGSRRALEVSALGAIAGLGVAWVFLDGQSSFLYRGGFAACGLGAAAVIAAAAHPQPGIVARLLSFRPLRLLGIISYGLYLWHWPVFVAMSEESTSMDGAALFAARVATSLALATVSFLLIERPIRHGTSSPGRVLVVAPAVAVLCVVAVIVTTAGAKSTSTDGPSIITSAAGPKVPARIDGVLESAASRRPGNLGERILVVGDSVASGVADGGASVQAERGVQMRNATVPGCILTPHVTDSRVDLHGDVHQGNFEYCEPSWFAGQRIVRPDAIVMIYGVAASFVDLQIDGEWASPCDARYRDWYTRELDVVVDRLGANGTELWIAKLPPMGADWPEPEGNERITCINEVHEAVASANRSVTMFQPFDVVCPGRCVREYEGSLLRRDGFHFNDKATVVIANKIIDVVLEARTATFSLQGLPDFY